MEGDLVPLLQARGISVQSTHPRVRGRRNGEHYEFDILAGNGEEMVVVEVKTTLKVDDVKQFLEKLNKFTEYEPVYQGKAGLWRGGVFADGAGLRIICRAAGLVRDPRHRQQRQHH